MCVCVGGEVCVRMCKGVRCVRRSVWIKGESGVWLRGGLT